VRRVGAISKAVADNVNAYMNQFLFTLGLLPLMLLFYRSSRLPGGRKRTSGIISALLALVFFGFTGITQKLATNEISTELSCIRFCVAMLVVAVFIYAISPLDWHVQKKIIGLAIVGGMLNGFGCITSFKAQEVGGKASIVVPLCNLYLLVAIFLAVVFLHEKLTGTAIAGIVLAMVAAFLLSQESSSEPPADGEAKPQDLATLPS